jgi:protein-tyrosine phosphatase
VRQVVVHCWGGGGRTGIALAAWLVKAYGLSPEQAASEIEATAKAQGASRRVDVAQLNTFLSG